MVEASFISFRSYGCALATRRNTGGQDLILALCHLSCLTKWDTG